MLAIAVLALAGVVFFLVQPQDAPSAVGADGGEPAAAAQSAASDLSDAEVDIAVDITVTRSDDLDSGEEEFSGTGVADLAGGLGRVTYDLSNLPNSAGAFGQLLSFDVVYEGSTAYVEIFKEEPSWVSFTPEMVAGQDLERLREVVLSSPLALPELIAQAEYSSGGGGSTFNGSLDPGSASTSDETSTAVLKALSDDLGVEKILLSVELDGSVVSSVRYRYDFPVAEGSQQEFRVNVSVDLSPTEGASIEVPSEDQVRTFESFFG